MDTNRSKNISLIISGLILTVFAGFYYFYNPEMWLSESIPVKYVIDVPTEENIADPSREVLGEFDETIDVPEIPEDQNEEQVYTFMVDGSEIAINENEIVEGLSPQVTIINNKTVRMIMENDNPVVTVDGVNVQVNKMPYQIWLNTNTSNPIIWEFN